MLFNTFVQTSLTAILLVAAVGYAAYRIYLTIKEAGNPCRGCSGCELEKALKGKHINPAKKISSCKGSTAAKKNIEKKCR